MKSASGQVESITRRTESFSLEDREPNEIPDEVFRLSQSHLPMSSDETTRDLGELVVPQTDPIEEEKEVQALLGDPAEVAAEHKLEAQPEPDLSAELEVAAVEDLEPFVFFSSCAHHLHD